MASNGISLAQGKRLSFGPHNVPNASLLMDKQKAILRRSTPDSEALVSSEDELDVQQRAAYNMPGQSMMPVRRPSWLNDGPQGLHRKASLGSSEARSPGGNPTAPTTSDASDWSAAITSLGRTATGNPSLPWSSTIWNSDNQRGLPSRFAEVLPSPTNFESSSNFSDEVVQSPNRRESSSEGSFPFAIPLQPTLKSYRSQSYSVGQLEHEAATQVQQRPSQNSYGVRARTGSSYSGLQHRPSRPSMLGEFSADTGLGQLREVEDDEDSTTSSGPRERYSSTQARQIEQLAMENAILRQQAQMSHSMGLGHSGTSYTSTGHSVVRPADRGLQISESVLEEPDDERPDEEDPVLMHSLARRGLAVRRQSEFATSPGSQLAASTSDSKHLIGPKKGHWQSSLGFGGTIDQPQSRRHSFADVPVRKSANGTTNMGTLRPSDMAPSHEDGFRHHLAAQHAPYFSVSQSHSAGAYTSSLAESSSQGSFAGFQQQSVNQYGQPQPHQGQSLYLVTFKAARAEFYYVQEGTGLEINPGDLVIVEADRGTDLGTVAHKDVDWGAARGLKEQYVAEHYNWLMMFSRQGQSGQGAPANGWKNPQMERPQSLQAGGTAPQTTTSLIDGQSAEIKPKMIKRLAQNHEIHSLREKEGNEAKAKRMCQQKVAEHHLNMEILDAEFQVDWKKLTFYYFADSYINFNSLVTDLFKIYKTRIWMSAINPASFVSTAAGPHIPSALAHTPLSHDNVRFPDSRHKMENFPQPSASPEATYEQHWTNQIENGHVAGSHGPYGQYWSGLSSQHAMPVGPDFSRGNAGSFRPSPTSASSQYQPGLSFLPRSSPGYETEAASPSSYADQLASFQSLSLGPAR